jgi:protein tyrosine/serine phosphatase
MARSAETLSRIGLFADDLHPLLLSDPATLQAVFHDLRADYGSLEAYLATFAGVDAETIDRLKERLLEADGD